MSEDHRGRLVDYYGVYAPTRFKSSSGKQFTRRCYQKKIKEFDLPIIPAAHGCPLIDPEAGDAQLARYARAPWTAPRGRGRPPQRAAE
jgi:hypothetical protein